MYFAIKLINVRNAMAYVHEKLFHNKMPQTLIITKKIIASSRTESEIKLNLNENGNCSIDKLVRWIDC